MEGGGTKKKFNEKTRSEEFLLGVRSDVERLEDYLVADSNHYRF